MKYLKLTIKPLTENLKDNTLTVDGTIAESSLREWVVKTILPILITELDQQRQLVRRVFGITDLLEVEQVKTRLMTADRDVVELPNDVFKTLDECIRGHKGLSADLMDFFVSFMAELEECAVRSESEGKRIYAESEGVNASFKEFYEAEGIKVVTSKSDEQECRLCGHKPEKKEEVVPTDEKEGEPADEDTAPEEKVERIIEVVVRRDEEATDEKTREEKEA